MEVCSLLSVPAAPRMLSKSRRVRAATEKSTPFLGQSLNFHMKTERNANSKHPHLRTRASGSTQAIGSGPKTAESGNQEATSKDKGLTFVAGATGRVGSRTVRELLKTGFRVRAGVRNAQRAQTLVQSVQQIKVYDDRNHGNSTPAVEKIEIVECDLEHRSNIEAAIGNASVVICCIGASEKEVFDVTGPYRIDYKATENLIDAATVAKVDHFILLTSLGTNKIGFPASILNLFWGVLVWKRKAEEALIASGLPYTIVRPGGMERPTDSYKETHNIVLANEDTYFGGQVSNLQVAELMAFMAKHRRLSFCKVVEVIAETTAPLTPVEELLAKIPSKREVPAELELDPVPISIESKPTGLAAEKVLGRREVSKTTLLSPYTVYDDLKPPTSPSPNAPTGSYHSTSAGDSDSTAATLTVSESSINVVTSDEDHVKQKRSRPLSPFTMYEDLKPPSSPVPSVPKY